MSNPTAFNDVLNSLKVSGVCLLAERYQPPWAIAIPDGKNLGKMHGLDESTRVVAFHLLRDGEIDLHTDDETTHVSAGEVVICTGSQSHVMSSGDNARVTAFEDLLKNRPSDLFVEHGDNTTDMICGVFLLANIRNNPLIDALPSIIQADVSGKNGSKTLSLLAQLLAEQVDDDRRFTNDMSARVLEMLCAEAIRVYLEKDGSSRPGWFAGLSDPKIGAALNHIHSQPESRLTVSLLARDVGMSTSRFAARFRQTLGISPMNYVTSWRMNIASRLLTETRLNTETIARKVGYDSPPAFSRAFAKHYNTPPARWRRRHAENTTAQS